MDYTPNVIISTHSQYEKLLRYLAFFFPYQVFEICILYYSTSQLGPATFQVLDRPMGLLAPIWDSPGLGHWEWDKSVWWWELGWEFPFVLLPRPDLPPFHCMTIDLPLSSAGLSPVLKSCCVGTLKISVARLRVCWKLARPHLFWSCHSWLWWPSDVRTLCLERRPTG